MARVGSIYAELGLQVDFQPLQCDVKRALGIGRFSEVHLTWKGGPAPSSDWSNAGCFVEIACSIVGGPGAEESDGSLVEGGAPRDGGAPSPLSVMWSPASTATGDVGAVGRGRVEVIDEMVLVHIESFRLVPRRLGERQLVSSDFESYRLVIDRSVGDLLANVLSSVDIPTSGPMPETLRSFVTARIAATLNAARAAALHRTCRFRFDHARLEIRKYRRDLAEGSASSGRAVRLDKHVESIACHVEAAEYALLWAEPRDTESLGSLMPVTVDREQLWGLLSETRRDVDLVYNAEDVVHSESRERLVARVTGAVAPPTFVLGLAGISYQLPMRDAAYAWVVVACAAIVAGVTGYALFPRLLELGGFGRSPRARPPRSRRKA